MLKSEISLIISYFALLNLSLIISTRLTIALLGLVNYSKIL